VLDATISSGERIYSAAYIVPNPPFGEARKHGNHLRLIEHAMAGLPPAVIAASSLRAVYELLAGLPSLGPFLAYQYAIDLGYTAITATNGNDFVVPGPGALDGISKCFTDTGGLSPAEVITWMRDTSPDHLDRLGRRPPLSTTGSRRNRDCRLSGRLSSALRERPGEHQAPVPQIPAQDPAAIQADRPQAPQAGTDRVRPLLASPGRHLQRIGHLAHAFQQARVRSLVLVPAVVPGLAEHRPCDRLVSNDRAATVLDVIHQGIRTPLQPGQAAQGRRPAQAYRVRQMHGVMPAVTGLSAGVVRQRITDRQAVDRHPHHFPERPWHKPL
jgi:hypothetical protein